MTRQRTLIYQIIQDSMTHLSAEEVFDLAKQEMPTIVRATVYNNLNALTEQGLIRRVIINGKPDLYDKTLKAHDHLICDGCGKITDINLGNVLQILRDRTGLPITSYDLNIHYLCDECGKHAKSRCLGAPEKNQ